MSPASDSRPNGLITDSRDVMELNLASAYLAGNFQVVSALLSFRVNTLVNVGAGEISPSATVLFGGYPGDGAMTTGDYNPGLTPLGSMTFTATGDYTIDLTQVTRDLLASNAQYAGINLRLDPASLPSRSAFTTDTTFGIRLDSAETDNGPTLTIDLQEQVVPEPFSIVLLGTVLLGSILISRRHR